MNDIVYDHTADNLGGGYRVRFAPVAEIAAMPTVAGAVTFRAGGRWAEVYGTDNSKNFGEDASETDNGPVWAVKINLFLPGDGAAIRAMLADMMRHRQVVEAQDNNGLWRRAGTLTEPMSFSYKFTTGDEVPDRRGAVLTWAGSLLTPAVIL